MDKQHNNQVLLSLKSVITWSSASEQGIHYWSYRRPVVSLVKVGSHIVSNAYKYKPSNVQGLISRLKQTHGMPTIWGCCSSYGWLACYTLMGRLSVVLLPGPLDVTSMSKNTLCRRGLPSNSDLQPSASKSAKHGGWTSFQLYNAIWDTYHS